MATLDYWEKINQNKTILTQAEKRFIHILNDKKTYEYLLLDTVSEKINFIHNQLTWYISLFWVTLLLSTGLLWMTLKPLTSINKNYLGWTFTSIFIGLTLITVFSILNSIKRRKNFHTVNIIPTTISPLLFLFKSLQRKNKIINTLKDNKSYNSVYEKNICFELLYKGISMEDLNYPEINHILIEKHKPLYQQILIINETKEINDAIDMDKIKKEPQKSFKV